MNYAGAKRDYINQLLTECEDRTGEYWPKVMAVQTECIEVRTKTTKGKCSPVQSRARELSCLLYGNVSLSDRTLLRLVNAHNLCLPSATVTIYM